MTTEGPDLDALERLAEQATPGPWESQASEDEPANALVYGPDGDSFAYLSWNPGNDYDVVATAAYIAALSPETVRTLIRWARAADDLYGGLVSEHGHDETHSADWPACLPIHIAMNRYRDARR